MPDTALLEAIRAVLAASTFHGEGHRKVWARLRMKGVRTARRRVLRLMREHDLLAPSRVGSPRGPRNHDGTIIPETLDSMWCQRRLNHPQKCRGKIPRFGFGDQPLLGSAPLGLGGLPRRRGGCA